GRRAEWDLYPVELRRPARLVPEARSDTYLASFGRQADRAVPPVHAIIGEAGAAGQGDPVRRRDLSDARRAREGPPAATHADDLRYPTPPPQPQAGVEPGGRDLHGAAKRRCSVIPGGPTGPSGRLRAVPFVPLRRQALSTDRVSDWPIYAAQSHTRA